MVDKLAKLALIAGMMTQEYMDINFPFKKMRVLANGKRYPGPYTLKSTNIEVTLWQENYTTLEGSLTSAALT